MNLDYYKKPKLPPAYTEEFRDPKVWQYLKERIIPRLRENRIVRVWSAGCAGGQEAFSVAALAQELRIKNQGSERKTHVSIYGTDISNDIINQAKNNAAIQQFNNIRFRIHDLAADPPLKYMNLILCRNVLMFFKPYYQQIICGRLYAGLITGGFLILGKVESLRGETAKKLAPINRSLRIYQKMI